MRLLREDIRTVVIDGVGPDFGGAVQRAGGAGDAADRRDRPPGDAVARGRRAASAPRRGAPAGGRRGARSSGGERRRIRRGWQTPPDVRIVRYLALDPSDPVIARMAPGQELLGLLIRTEIDASGGANQGDATVVARWGPGPSERAELKVTLPRSRFEWWNEGFDASELAARDPPAAGGGGADRDHGRREDAPAAARDRAGRERDAVPAAVPGHAGRGRDVALRAFDVSTWTDVRGVQPRRSGAEGALLGSARAGADRAGGGGREVERRIGRSGCSSRSTRRCAGGC